MNKNLIRLTESDLHRIVKESVAIILEGFGKGNKYSFNGDGNEDCEFLTYNGHSIGLVDHFNKVVSPCHGYYFPSNRSKGLMNHAKRLGYVYDDPEMPKELNKTLK